MGVSRFGLRFLFPAVAAVVVGCASSLPSESSKVMAERTLPLSTRLAAACGAPAEFVRASLEESDEGTRAQLSAWNVGEAVAPQARTSMIQIAKSYLLKCGVEEAIQLTTDLVRFPTVSAQQDAATGPAFVAMASHLSRWATQNGLAFQKFGENAVWIVRVGEGAPMVDFVAHADVVPVSDADGTLTPEGLPQGWNYPPFEVVREEGRLYGRGTEDDKGAIAATLVVLHTLKRFGLAPAGAVRTVMGTGEEHDWDPMVAYAKEAPHARFTISIDAGYPVVVAQSGFVAWRLSAPLNSKVKAKKPCAVVSAAHAGQFLTQVPQEAWLDMKPGAGLKFDTLDLQTKQAVERARGELPGGFGYEITHDGAAVRVMVTGEAVHSSVAPDGRNALWALSAVAAGLPLCPSGVASTLRFVHEKLSGDHWGEKLGIGQEHAVMGKLLVVPTMLRVESDKATLSINMRRPAGPTAEEFGASLNAALLRATKELGIELKEEPGGYIGEPAIADTDGPLVSTLLGIYRETTGDKEAAPLAIRGGTYARLFPGAVDFGPSLPGRPYRGHAPDEYMEIEALELLMKMSFDAVLKLSALPRE